ncbi:hypothetical protein TNCT_357561 [Trichonephila clavata]|uniref:Uncharacterized protein n=1 Tax=Trichonephila clavata TaxID=2740835 RepID=A0A8X6M309_TRICU|nr:hypothetical protein TNCT_357561 [Trichonephila clavata]
MGWDGASIAQINTSIGLVLSVWDWKTILSRNGFDIFLRTKTIPRTKNEERLCVFYIFFAYFGEMGIESSIGTLIKTLKKKGSLGQKREK